MIHLGNKFKNRKSTSYQVHVADYRIICDTNVIRIIYTLLLVWYDYFSIIVWSHCSLLKTKNDIKCLFWTRKIKYSNYSETMLLIPSRNRNVHLKLRWSYTMQWLSFYDIFFFKAPAFFLTCLLNSMFSIAFTDVSYNAHYPWTVGSNL